MHFTFYSIILILILFLYIDSKRSNNKRILTPKDIGDIGENKLYRPLKLLSYFLGFEILQNIMLKTINGSTQIDLILITKKSIFIIEVKNMSGLIIGNIDYNMWIQKTKTNINMFYNPILQNNGHIKAINNILEYNIPIVSVISFIGTATLEKETQNIFAKNLIIGSGGYLNTIKKILLFNIKYFKKNDTIQLKLIKNLILSKNISDDYLATENHYKYIDKLEK